MSNQDPQWGGKRPDGPPDLDEIVRQFNNRIARLFGGGRGGNSRSGGAGVLVLAMAALVVATWLASGFYVVDAREKGVVLRFGRFVELTEPGLRWHVPYPVEAREIVNLSQVRTVDIGFRRDAKDPEPKEALMLTDDENIVDVQFAVQYDIADPRSFVFNNRFGSRDAEDVVRSVAETAIREVVGKSKIDYVLSEGREEIARAATEKMQQLLDYNYLAEPVKAREEAKALAEKRKRAGAAAVLTDAEKRVVERSYASGIRVLRVTMQNAQPPEQVQEAFQDVQKAVQDADREKNVGEAYRNNVVPKSRGEAARLLQEAEAHKSRVILTAEGDAARFNQVYAEYAKAPAVTRERLYIEAMQQIYGSTSKVMIDQKNNNSLLYLPLDKLLAATAPERAASNAPASGHSNNPSAQSAPAALPQPLPAPARDAGRTSERESR